MPWTRELLAHNRLLVSEDAGETVGRHADRTLLISWPEPGAAWLPVAVKTHASAGGKHFVLKFGGFVGFWMPGDRPHQLPINAGGNIASFFELIAQDWKEVPPSGRPPWVPQALENNLLIFERTAPGSPHRSARRDRRATASRHTSPPGASASHVVGDQLHTGAGGDSRRSYQRCGGPAPPNARHSRCLDSWSTPIGGRYGRARSSKSAPRWRS